MPYEITIHNVKGQVEHIVRDADPVAPTGDTTNYTFEDAISEVSCAARGDIIEIKDLKTEEVLIGCLFKHKRTGIRGSTWYSEIMLVTALATEDGRASRKWSACSVWTDHMERVNLVKLVPVGGTYDDGDNDFDPEVTSPAGSPRARRRMEAYQEHKKNTS
eukprot:PhF_6_TR21997/c0_g1_i1/m.31269